MSTVSGNTGLTSRVGQRTFSVPLLWVTLRGQWEAIWSVKSSHSLLFSPSWREYGPSGGPGCDHHICKCGKQRLTSYEPCVTINTDGFSFPYWRES